MNDLYSAAALARANCDFDGFAKMSAGQLEILLQKVQANALKWAIDFIHEDPGVVMLEKKLRELES